MLVGLHVPTKLLESIMGGGGGGSLATLMAGNAKEADKMIWGICARSARQI